MGIEVVKLSDIRENPVALRTVNKQSESYLGLVDSIRQKGFLGSITGRKKQDEAGTEYIEITDGLHRYNAAKDAGLTTIPIDILSLDDAETLEAQILMNVHKVDTRPVEYSNQLRRILAMNPMMTEAELATKLGKSAQWIKERLGLVKLPEKVAELVDEGKINLTNAYALAKLPPEESADWVDRAMTETPTEFCPKVNGRVKEIKDAKRKGKDASASEFTPVAHLQKLAAIKEEMESPKVGPTLVKKHKLKSAEEGFAMGIKWALHMDPESIEAAKSKYEAQKEAKEEAKKRRAAERAEKKAKEAAEAAAKAKAKVEE